MRKFIHPGFISSLAVILFISSCNKSSQVPTVNTGNPDAEITAMVNLSSSAMDYQEVFTDDVSGDIFVLNEGITPDFLVDQSYMENNPSGDDSSRIYIRDHSFIECFRGLALSDTQAAQVRTGLRVYNACKDKAVHRAKLIYKDLREKYRILYGRLLTALQNGTITRTEFRARVSDLKEAFRTELRRTHLQEKLDIALTKCLREILNELHGILTERQWNAFKICYLQHR